MEDVKDSFQIFEPSCLNENKTRLVTQNVTFPDSECLVETPSSLIVAENDCAFIETSDCFAVSASSIKASETFSESFSNNTSPNISNDKRGIFSKADSAIMESESIADDSLKVIGFHGIEQSLSENSGNMTFDLHFSENCQFEDEEFHSSIDFFNDPSFLNFLENSSSSTVQSNPLVVRNSLYRKFDPLYVNYFSQYNNLPNEHLNAVKGKIDTKTGNSANTLPFNNAQNEVQCNTTLRQSIGNMLISFDAPIIEKRKISFSENASICDSQKIYTEEDLTKALENQEFAIRGNFLRKQKDLEELFLRKMQEFEIAFEKQKCLSNSLCIILKEAMHLVNVCTEKKALLEKKLAKAEKDKNNLEEDLDTFVRDLQNLKDTFSDFHKEFEESASMLKLYVKNENLTKQLENMNMQLNDKDKLYKEFQSRSLEIMDKSNIKITSPNKSSEV